MPPARPARTGRWLLRSRSELVVARFGDPIILLPRAQVIDALLAQVPRSALALSTEVSSVVTGGPSRGTLTMPCLAQMQGACLRSMQ